MKVDRRSEKHWFAAQVERDCGRKLACNNDSDLTQREKKLTVRLYQNFTTTRFY